MRAAAMIHGRLQKVTGHGRQLLAVQRLLRQVGDGSRQVGDGVTDHGRGDVRPACLASVKTAFWNVSMLAAISSPPRSGGKASEMMRIGVMNSRSKRDTDAAEPMSEDVVSSLMMRDQRPPISQWRHVEAAGQGRACMWGDVGRCGDIWGDLGTHLMRSHRPGSARYPKSVNK